MKYFVAVLLVLAALACYASAQGGERVYAAYDDDDVPSVATGTQHRPVYYYPIDDDFADREGTYYQYNFNVYDSPSSDAATVAASAGLLAAGLLALF